MTMRSIVPLARAIYEDKNQVRLEGSMVKLRGTLISYKDRMMLELTDGPESIMSSFKPEVDPKRETYIKGEATFYGEIYDPQCAFGIMKPGSGKAHRSCAIRCISGGVPPILAVKRGDGEEAFVILKGANGEGINDEVLHVVGDFIRVCGELRKVDDWYVMRLDPSSDILRIQPHWMLEDMPLCSE